MKKNIIYWDESCVNNKEYQYMSVGTVFCNKEERRTIKNDIKAIKEQYWVKTEIKRRKVNTTMLPFYKAIIDYFIDSPLQYYGIRIDKSQQNLEKYHNDSPDTALYKRYYFLLKNRLKNDTQYYIYLDKRLTKEKDKLQKLEEFLKYEERTSEKSYSIHSVREFPSRNHAIMQFADLLTWCICFAHNHPKQEETAKHQLVQYLSDKLWKDIRSCSRFGDDKCNIFCIHLADG